MERLVIFFAVCFATIYAARDQWTGFSVVWPFSDTGKNTQWAFEVPLFIGEEVPSGEWIEIKVDNFYNLRTLSYRVNYDYGFMPLYDQNGFIAGAQLCQPYDVIVRTEPSYYDPPSQGTVEIITINDNKFYCSSYLIVSPETIKAGGRTSVGTPIGEGLWLRDTSNIEVGYLKIPDSISELLATTEYVWQTCARGMGAHFFKHQYYDFKCSELYNWFLLGDVVNTDSVTGIGIMIYGRSTVFNTNYYDNNTRDAVTTITPYTNPCFFDTTEIYGLVSVHMYFNDSPETIVCQEGDNVNPPPRNTTAVTKATIQRKSTRKDERKMKGRRYGY